MENLDAGSAGRYDVVISNSVGSVTSDSAQVSISEPSGPPRGIFLGRFAGQEASGGFAVMVNSDGKAVMLGYSPVQGQGMVATNFTVSVDNSFEVPSTRGGTLKGVFAGDAVSGSFASTNATTETFGGVLKEATGIHESSSGYYEGTFGGLLAGDASLILAADGTVFVYTFSTVVGGGGTFAIIDASNKVSATTEFTLPGTTIPGVLSIDGALNPSTHKFSGTYGFGGIQLGTISIARVSVP
ncbi:MAG: hypothetical protein O2960_05860 [Verrucomicrobia bacterium]|nr:hypothetical protein [Verrucomicrobiota bacterium]